MNTAIPTSQSSVSKMEFNSTLKMVDNPAATFVLNLESDDTKVKGAVTAENLNDLLQRVSETLTKAVQDEDNND